MSWQTEALRNPVLAWEMKRATRRKLWRYLQLGYCAWLLIQALTYFRAVGFTTRELPTNPSARLELFRDMTAQQSLFFDNYLTRVLQLQLVLVIAIVPVVTASALGQEKERGTLFELFGTQLTASQILLGKLLGRLMVIAPLALTTVPILVFLAALSGRGLLLIIPALLQQATIAFALGAACLLFGIWIRGAADAVVASYLFLGLPYVIIRVLTSSVPGAFWIDPIENLVEMLNGGNLLPFTAHLAVSFVLGMLCLRLGWGFLRTVCVEQRDKRPSRRLWAFRPPIRGNPIRWRECHVIGLTPMPILRIVPKWLAILSVFAFSIAVAGVLANTAVPGFVPALINMDLAQAAEKLQSPRNDLQEYVPLMGLVFVLMGSMIIGVRCGTSVAEEKRRNTWDDLLLTAQSFREITTEKMWGVLQATVPYIVAYALPMIFLASLGGRASLVTGLLWLLLPCGLVYGSALMGIDMLRVPPDMDETRVGGAFWFEKNENERSEIQVLLHMKAKRKTTAEDVPACPGAPADDPLWAAITEEVYRDRTRDSQEDILE